MKEIAFNKKNPVNITSFCINTSKVASLQGGKIYGSATLES